MKILFLILTFLIFTGASIPTRRVYEDVGGDKVIKGYPENMRRTGETDKQMMDRIDTEEGETKTVLGDVDIADVPHRNGKEDLEDIEKWEVKAQGGKKVIQINPAKPSPKKDARILRAQNRESGKAKLTGEGQALTVSEIEALFP